MDTISWYYNDNTVRVYYFSPVNNIGHSMVADINIRNDNIQLYEGAGKETLLNMLLTNIHVQGYVELRNDNIKRNAMNVVEHVLQINGVNGNDSFRLLLLHMKSSLDYNYTYNEVHERSATEICSRVDNTYLINCSSDDSKNHYYVGITNDLDRRMQEHRERDFQIHNETVYAWICQNATIAAEVEDRLGHEGYCIGGNNHGGNGGVEDSRIVYMLKKA